MKSEWHTGTHILEIKYNNNDYLHRLCTVKAHLCLYNIIINMYTFTIIISSVDKRNGSKIIVKFFSA